MNSANSKNQNVEAINAYLMFFISGFLVLKTEKNNQFVRFHAYQSIYYSLIFLVFIALVNYIPVVGSFIVKLATSVFFLTWIYLILTTYQNKEIKLPFIGDIAERESKK